MSLPGKKSTLVMRLGRAGGRKIVKSAQPTFYGGYAGYFQDLDGHLWEVAFNPGFASAGLTRTSRGTCSASHGSCFFRGPDRTSSSWFGVRYVPT